MGKGRITLELSVSLVEYVYRRGGHFTISPVEEAGEKKYVASAVTWDVKEIPNVGLLEMEKK